MKIRDLTGHSFGRLVALQRRSIPGPTRPRSFWLCRCSCGALKEVDASALLSGDTSSCGCLQKELMSARRSTHGEINTRRYKTWCGIIQRCNNPENSGFKNYGGRGIKVFQKWLSYEGFAEDVSHPPQGRYSLDRIDNDGDYEPGNVRWATAREQGRNRRFLRLVDYGGETLCLTEAAERAAISYRAVHHRIAALGWTPEKALQTPVRAIRRKPFNAPPERRS